MCFSNEYLPMNLFLLENTIYSSVVIPCFISLSYFYIFEINGLEKHTFLLGIYFSQWPDGDGHIKVFGKT